jgi:signal transduction histidine kinase
MIALITLLIYIFNEVYFEKYYFNIKKEQLLEVAEELKEKGPDFDLWKFERENNMKINLLPFEFTDIEFPRDSNLEKEKIKSLSKNVGEYFYKRDKERFLEIEVLRLYTAYDDKRLLIVGTPINSIKEPIEIMTNYHMKIILLTFILGMTLMKLFSNKITKPLIEIQEVAQRVSRFDFSKKIFRNSGDEIGNLGESINIMSDELENNIQELNIAKRKLETANRILLEDIEKERHIEEMRKEFISNVSHELKTPIAVISNYTEGLREGIAPDEDTRDFYLNIIQEEAMEMDKLVKSLLLLSQMERGYIDFKMKNFNMKEIINKELNINSLIIDKKGINLKAEIEDGYIFGDYDKISMVIRNLISNSIKYVTENGMIWLKLNKNNNNLRFEIFNNCMVKEEELEKLWLPFFRLDKSRVRNSGTGLGLTLVKEILENHNYKFGIEKHDDGLIFWFEGKEGEQC